MNHSFIFKYSYTSAIFSQEARRPGGPEAGKPGCWEAGKLGY
jgi:hypothetical protein